jgi:hypothetical protein
MGDLNADMLVTGDTCSGTGTRHASLAQLSRALDNEDWDSCDVYGAEKTRTECVMRGKKTKRIVNIFCN